MRRQKSTYTMRSLATEVREDGDPQNCIPALTEASTNWNSSYILPTKEQLDTFMSFENQFLNLDPALYNMDPNAWNSFCYSQEHTKPELIATPSDIFDEFSEVSLPVEFGDFAPTYPLDLQEPFLPLNNWQEPTEVVLPQYQNLHPFSNEYSYEQPILPYLYPNYCGDVGYPMFPYNFPPRLFVTNYRSVSVMLRHLVSVDVSPEGAIYVHNIPGQSMAVVSDSGEKACIIHPNSRVLQEGQNVHIMSHQARLVKICHRGVTFATNPGSIVYLVDESGTKSTSGKFMDLSRDFSTDVFYGQHATALRSADSLSLLSSSTYEQSRSGDDVWSIGNVQVKQDQYGRIEVSRDFSEVLVTVLPTAGEVSVRTDAVNMTVNCFSKRYLSVQKDNCRVTSGFCGLSVQNGTQKAGLDRNGKVVIF